MDELLTERKKQKHRIDDLSEELKVIAWCSTNKQLCLVLIFFNFLRIFTPHAIVSER